jgi:trimeric autotransporter adhesin
MRKLFTLFLTGLIFHGVSFAQLSGSKNIPGDFPSIASAISTLNTQGVGAGGVTFNIVPGYTETFASPTDGLITTQTSTSINPVAFQKNGSGINPKIISAYGSGTRDYIIGIAGTDYITFDGIDVMDDPANTDNTSQSEYGFLLMKAAADTSGSQFNTIKNCTITLQNINTATIGICLRNWRYVEPTWYTPILKTTRQANSYNSFQGNTITHCFSGINMIGYGVQEFQDQSNDIGSVAGNTIINFGSNSGTAEGIFTQYENNMIIANNLITGTVEGGTCYGMHFQLTVNGNLNLYGNTISIQYLGTFTFAGIRDYMG